MLFKKSYYIFILIISFNASAQEPTSLKEQTKAELTEIHIAEITIDGMACQEGCANTIAANLKKEQGVEFVEVSFLTGKAKIKFNGSQIELEKIENIITSTKVKDYVYTITESTLKN